MRNVLIPAVCLLLGLATGYMLTTFTATVEVTPAMIEQGIRENPRLVLDLMRQYPEEVFEVVMQGQEIKQKKARNEQILAQLLDPVEVEYDPDRPVRGPGDAPITIVEFSDFQCPHCAKASETVEEVVKSLPGKVNQVFLHFPLSSHQLAPLAAAYYEAAALQDKDKAWQLHDLIFENQDKLNQGGPDWLREAAGSLGLDMEQLQKDLGSPEVRERMQADLEQAKKIGLRGTPSYIIDGVVVSGAMPKQDFLEVIELISENRPRSPQDSQAQQQSGTAGQQEAASQSRQPQ